MGDIECGRLFDAGELALRLCDDNAGGLLLKLLSGGPIEFEFDWPGVTASKAEP